MEESIETKPSLQYLSHSNFHTSSSHLTRTPTYLKAYENHFGETTVCNVTETLGFWSIFLLKCTCTVPEYQCCGRCSCLCCLHASFSVGGGTLLAETMESCLRVILSNSAWTSVKPGFCPWKNGKQIPK